MSVEHAAVCILLSPTASRPNRHLSGRDNSARRADLASQATACSSFVSPRFALVGAHRLAYHELKKTCVSLGTKPRCSKMYSAPDWLLVRGSQRLRRCCCDADCKSLWRRGALLWSVETSRALGSKETLHDVLALGRRVTQLSVGCSILK